MTVETSSAVLESRDVVVIGGGPAGSTAAALLAERGHRVALLEKAHHPRFHIGESLLPANMALLKQLGVDAEVAALGMEKWGIEFVSPWHEHHTTLEFGQAWDKDMPMAYQVRRADFDHVLIRNAARRGAEVVEGCRVREVALRGDGTGGVVTGQLDDGTTVRYDARVVIDASGRDTFLANQLGAKVKNAEHNSAALYGHFSNAQRLEGRLEGNITIFWFAHGWFWFIPLSDGATSVGAVCWPYYLKGRGRDRSLNDFLMDTIALCPPLAERLRDAHLLADAEATGNYSYATTHAQGPDYLLLGDAFAFVDPVFSSGVFLAMNSAFVGADLVDARLKRPAALRAATRRFEKVMAKGPREFSWFIYRVTNPTMRDLFMAPKNVFRVREALLSLFAGDIFGRTPIWPSIFVFKTIYRISSLFNARRTLDAMRRRRINIRDVDARDGLTDAGFPPRHDVIRTARVRSSWSATCAAIVVGLVALVRLGGVQAEERPLWEAGFGLGALYLPDYRGSDESRAYLLPIPYVIYRGEIIKADREGVRAEFLDSDRIRFEIATNASQPVRSSSNRARQGMPDLKGSLELGPALVVNLARSENRGMKLDLRLPVSTGVTLGSGFKNIGLQTSPRLNLDVFDVAGYSGLNLGLAAGPVFQNRTRDAYFYDVAEQYARADRPAYRSHAGYAGAQFLAALSKRFDRYWIGAFVRADTLAGASFDDSPLVRRRGYFATGIGFAWIFGQSRETVDVIETR